jgi:hypothetical protein
MTNVLHLHARPGTPIVCDMRGADDTPDERLREYSRLFERALLHRERRADAVVFVFRADPDTRPVVDDLARREAACCPFLDYRIETVGDQVIWTVSNTIAGDARASVDAILDAFHDLPARSTTCPMASARGGTGARPRAPCRAPAASG